MPHHLAAPPPVPFSEQLGASLCLLSGPLALIALFSAAQIWLAVREARRVRRAR